MAARNSSMLVAPITSTALKSAPAELAGIASGVNSTVSRLGNLIAVAVIGLVISLAVLAYLVYALFRAGLPADREPGDLHVDHPPSHRHGI